MRANNRGRRNSGVPVIPIIIAGVILAIVTVVVIFFVTRPKRTPIDLTSVENIKPDASKLTKMGDYYTYNDPDKNVTSVLGIDVSSHQGDVDWKKVKAAGVDFVFIRLGLRGYESGAVVLDECYLDNIKEARKAGLNVGVYFFSQALNADEAAEEADFVIENLKGHDIDLQVVYDFEIVLQDTSRSNTLDPIDYNENARIFCEKIKTAGYTPMIYTNSYFAENYYDMKALASYDIWFANYDENPELSSGFAVWQYTEEGSIETAEMYPLDFDVMFVKKTETE